MKKENCIVCNRIPPKEVARLAHMAFPTTDKQAVHQIIVESCKAINYVDGKNRMFFCGRSRIALLAGLFYILGTRYAPSDTTQIKLAYNLPSIHRQVKYHKKWQSPPNEHLTETTIRTNYTRWMRQFPELFSDVKEKMRRKGAHVERF